MRFASYLLAEASRGDYYTHDGQGGKSAPTQWHGPEQLLAVVRDRPGEGRRDEALWDP